MATTSSYHEMRSTLPKPGFARAHDGTTLRFFLTPSWEKEHDTCILHWVVRTRHSAESWPIRSKSVPVLHPLRFAQLSGTRIKRERKHAAANWVLRPTLSALPKQPSARSQGNHQRAPRYGMVILGRARRLRDVSGTMPMPRLQVTLR